MNRFALPFISNLVPAFVNVMICVTYGLNGPLLLNLWLAAFSGLAALGFFCKMIATRGSDDGRR